MVCRGGRQMIFVFSRAAQSGLRKPVARCANFHPQGPRMDQSQQKHTSGGSTWLCVRLSPRSWCWCSDGFVVHPDAFRAARSQGGCFVLLTMPDRGRTHALQSARVDTVILQRAFQRLL